MCLGQRTYRHFQIKGIVKRAELCKFDILLVSRILWHAGLAVFLGLGMSCIALAFLLPESICFWFGSATFLEVILTSVWMTYIGVVNVFCRGYFYWSKWVRRRGKNCSLENSLWFIFTVLLLLYFILECFVCFCKSSYWRCAVKDRCS